MYYLLMNGVILCLASDLALGSPSSVFLFSDSRFLDSFHFDVVFGGKQFDIRV